MKLDITLRPRGGTTAGVTTRTVCRLRHLRTLATDKEMHRDTQEHDFLRAVVRGCAEPTPEHHT
eukprot:138333-Pyramimonas_sp.AAC.2